MNNRIKDIRTETGLSQSQFAKKYKIPLRSLQEWEQNRKTPPEYVIKMLSHEVLQSDICKYIISYEDIPVLKLVYMGNKLIDSTVLTDKKIIIPIQCEINEASVFTFLKSRCYEDNRIDLPVILNKAGLNDNNPWKWIELTHGAVYEDCWWIKKEGEAVTWKQIRIR